MTSCTRWPAASAWRFAGTWLSHYDISKSKRALAVQAGAVEIDKRQLAAILRQRREAGARP